MWTVVAIVVAAVAATVQASFFEWAFHRYWLHKPWLPASCFRAHTLVHHQLCKFEDTFQVVDPEQREALTFAWYGGPLLIAMNAAPWCLVAIGLSALGLGLPYAAFLITLSAVAALYYAGYEGSHYLMHRPSIAFVEGTRAFQFLKRHHRIHHVQMDRNLNVLLPLADWCLGTLILTRPDGAPRITNEAARRTARRYSRYAKPDAAKSE
ncbi:MAG TPA: sterol desaturase family protein [Armatimonadota bacterium]|jgi:hypothetical protein